MKTLFFIVFMSIAFVSTYSQNTYIFNEMKLCTFDAERKVFHDFCMPTGKTGAISFSKNFEALTLQVEGQPRSINFKISSIQGAEDAPSYLIKATEISSNTEYILLYHEDESLWEWIMVSEGKIIKLQYFINDIFRNNQ